MNVTDQQVETALITWFKNEVSWDKGMAPWSADQFRVEMRATLEAALSASPAGVGVETAPPSYHVAGEPHPDDIAVDRFAAAMKAKLAQKRAEGRGGWDNPNECSIEWLSELLRSHVEKSDPVDVGNFAMMIHQRGGRICK